MTTSVTRIRQRVECEPSQSSNPEDTTCYLVKEEVATQHNS